jgi:hypothetical protein
VQQSPPLLAKWLEYLYALNLEQFDIDIWKAMLKCNKRSSELTCKATQQREDIRFCHYNMKSMFSIDGNLKPSYFITGNKMRFKKVVDLLDFLFLWEDDKKRSGWGNKLY